MTYGTENINNDNDADDQGAGEPTDTLGVNANDMSSTLDLMSQVMAATRQKFGLGGAGSDQNAEGNYGQYSQPYQPQQTYQQATANAAAAPLAFDYGGPVPDTNEQPEAGATPAPPMEGASKDVEGGQEGEQGNMDAAIALAQHYRSRYTAYKAFAAAALNGSDQKPPDMMAAARAATQAFPNALSGATAQFMPTGNGFTVAVTHPGDQAPSEMMPMSQDDMRAFLQGPAGNFDNVQANGVGALKQAMGGGKAKVLGGGKSSLPHGKKGKVKRYDDGGEVDDDITTQNPADQEADVDETPESPVPSGEADVFEATPEPGPESNTPPEQPGMFGSARQGLSQLGQQAGDLLGYVLGKGGADPAMAQQAEAAVDPQQQIPEGERKVKAVEAAHQGLPPSTVPASWMQQQQAAPAQPQAALQQPQTPYDQFINQRRPGEEDYDQQDIQAANANFASQGKSLERLKFLQGQKQQQTENALAKTKAEKPFGVAEMNNASHERIAASNNATKESIAGQHMAAVQAMSDAKNRTAVANTLAKIAATSQDAKLRFLGSQMNSVLRDPRGADLNRLQQFIDATPGAQQLLNQALKVSGVAAPQAVTPQAQAPQALSAQDQQALQWANTNPKDPRSTLIHQRLGM